VFGEGARVGGGVDPERRAEERLRSLVRPAGGPGQHLPSVPSQTRLG